MAAATPRIIVVGGGLAGLSAVIKMSLKSAVLFQHSPMRCGDAE